MSEQIGSREYWKEKLLRAEMPEEVVTEFLKSLKDEDLVRMKDLTDIPDDELAQVLRDTIMKGDVSDTGDVEEDDDEEKKDEDEDTPPVTTDDGSTDELVAEVLAHIGNSVVTQVKDSLESGTIEIKNVSESEHLKSMMEELASLKEQVAAVSASLKDMFSVFKDMSVSDKDRIRGLVDNLSPAQKSRLKLSLSDADTAARVIALMESRKDSTLATGVTETEPPAPGGSKTPFMDEGGAVFKDSDGTYYRSASDMVPLSRQ